MKKELARYINNQLFNIQFEYNGLYGYFISYRLVTDNKSFQVQVFHNSVKEKVLTVSNEMDIKKVKNIFDL